VDRKQKKAWHRRRRLSHVPHAGLLDLTQKRHGIDATYRVFRTRARRVAFVGIVKRVNV
jgi:hypothetical protein